MIRRFWTVEVRAVYELKERAAIQHGDHPPEILYKVKSKVWVLDLLFDWGIIVAVFFLVHYLKSAIVLPFALLLIGSRQHALGFLGHDAAHRTAFKNKALNDIIGNFFIAWPVFAVINDGYRPWHLEHHKFLGTTQDPELHFLNSAPYRDKVNTPRAIRFFITDMMGLGVLDMYKFMSEIFPHKKPSRFLGPILMWGIFLAISIYTHSMWIFFLWACSLITGFWAAFRVRTWTEHLGVNRNGKESSHRFLAGPLIRFFFLPHNTYCHYEHHRWSQIPYYNLPKVRALYGEPRIEELSEVFNQVST